MSYAYRQDLNWLVTDFTTRVADVAHAVVVSADGVPLALSEHIPHQFAEQLAVPVAAYDQDCVLRSGTACFDQLLRGPMDRDLGPRGPQQRD